MYQNPRWIPDVLQSKDVDWVLAMSFLSCSVTARSQIGSDISCSEIDDAISRSALRDEAGSARAEGSVTVIAAATGRNISRDG